MSNKTGGLSFQFMARYVNGERFDDSIVVDVSYATHLETTVSLDDKDAIRDLIKEREPAFVEQLFAHLVKRERVWMTTIGESACAVTEIGPDDYRTHIEPIYGGLTHKREISEDVWSDLMNEDDVVIPEPESVEWRKGVGDLTDA